MKEYLLIFLMFMAGMQYNRWAHRRWLHRFDPEEYQKLSDEQIRHRNGRDLK